MLETSEVKGGVEMFDFIFQKDFLWGAASSAVQIEAAANEDGKGQNVADFYSRKFPEKYNKGEIPDTAADFYHRYNEDIGMMKDLGLKSFRFSISWARIYPDGNEKINQKGIDYYSKMIDTLLQNGIVPMFDLFHADMPMWVAERGGPKNSDFVNWFSDYAYTCFKNFGDRVKLWNTVNEPSINVFRTYAFAQTPPFETSIKNGFTSSHNMLMAHFNAIKLYRSMNLGGKISAVSSFAPVYANSLGQQDKDAATRAFDFHSGWWLEPMVKGRYPQELLSYPYVYENMPKSSIEKLKDSFTPMDHIGINYYSPGLAMYKKNDMLDFERLKMDLPKDDYGFLIYPQGLFDSIMYLKKEFNDPEIYITENGIAKEGSSDEISDADDDYRINYLREHLRAVSRSIKAGANVKGYYHWTIMDTYETHSGGYKLKFGLVQINFDNLKRTPRKSWKYYRNIIKNNAVE